MNIRRPIPRARIHHEHLEEVGLILENEVELISEEDDPSRPQLGNVEVEFERDLFQRMISQSAICLVRAKLSTNLIAYFNLIDWNLPRASEELFRGTFQHILQETIHLGSVIGIIRTLCFGY